MVFVVSLFVGLLLYPVFTEFYTPLLNLVNNTIHVTGFEAALYGLVPIALLVSILLTPLIHLVRGDKVDLL